jgi:transcription antitermination factor NusG
MQQQSISCPVFGAPNATFDTTEAWYAIHVRANYEKRVSAAMRQKGYAIYLPIITEPRRWSDRVVDCEIPLFPGYLFGRVDPLNRLPVLKTDGVIQILGNGSSPTPIASETLHAIQRMTSTPAGAMPFPYLKAGQRIRVRSGPLSGVEGILMRRKGARYLVVSIDLLNRSVATEIDVADIKP